MPQRPQSKFQLDSPTPKWNEYSIENVNDIFVLFGQPRRGKPVLTGNSDAGTVGGRSRMDDRLSWRQEVPEKIGATGRHLWRKQQ
jgi:hypothetical protein